MTETSILSTCPRDCYDSCGLRVVIDDTGKINRVTGDPDHPSNRGSLCGKCALAYNGVWLDAEQRLTRPLVRTGPKGAGEFKPVSWDEALARVADRLGRLGDSGRAHDVITAHYTGTCSALANQFPMRFFNAIGATEVEPDSICNLSGHVGLGYMLGESAKGFDPRTARDSACLIVWGANPSASGPHADKHWLTEFPGTVVVIDPLVTKTAGQADMHLRPYPGTDAALAFGFIHALRAGGHLNDAFIAEHTVGFDELGPLIDAWPVERASEVTGVPAEQIHAVSAAYAAGPAMLWLGQALCRGPTGGNAFRAASLLPAVTGNIGKPGTGIYFLNGKGPTRGLDMGAVGRGDLRAEPSPSLSHMDLRETLDRSPRDKALVLWNINVAASNPDQGRLLETLASEALFTVVVDLFMTDSARYADVVLPAASFLEFDDLVGSYFHLSVGAQSKAAEPPGEALPNQEIFRRLSRAMGLEEPLLYETDAEVLERLIAPLDLSFEELKTKGTVYPSAEPLVLWEELDFPTPSGKIELASDTAELHGHPRTPVPDPLPRPSGGMLRLLTPADEWHMNSSYDNEPRIHERTPDIVTVHPVDAARLGLAPGMRVRLANAAGSLEMECAVDHSALEGVAFAPKGRWPSRTPAGFNVNVLNPGLRSDMGNSTGLHGVEVEVTKVGE